jgi:hypothetical protein
MKFCSNQTGEKSMTDVIDEGLVDQTTPPQTETRKRKPRSDKGAQRSQKTANGLIAVRLEIEPESAFSLHRWLVENGYEDAAVALTQQSVKHFDNLRLAIEREN